MNRNRLLLIGVAAVALTALLVTGALLTWRMLLSSPEVADDFSPETEETPVAAAEIGGSSTISNALSTGTMDTGTSDTGTNGEAAFIEAAGMAPVTLNPVYATDSAALTIIDKIYPRLLGQDPTGGFIVPSALAERWEISPDGRTYTFVLRPGVRWSDGEAVTAADFKFTYEALASPLVQSPYRDRTVGIVKVDAPDPNTVVVTLAGPNCAILHSLRQPLLPSHKFAADFSDLATSTLNQQPEVSAGPFLFTERIEAQPGEAAKVRLNRNPEYWQGAAQIEQWEVQIIPDPNARRQALAEGLVDLAYFDADEVAAEREEIALPETVTMKYLATDGYSFLALNLADPANPQAGRASDGAGVAQSPHPILGDLAVRQAIAAAIDYDSIIAEVYQGHAGRTASYVPAIVNWAYANDLTLPSYDPARAAQLLEEVGWVDEEGDGMRSRGGQPLHLSIRTNEDNPKRVQMAQLIADQLRAVGVEVELNVIPFDGLTADLLDQRFDMVVIGWENLGADPGNSPFWHSQADIPGTGFNFTSFHDEEVDGWLENATRLAGCDLNQRGELYRQVQQRVAAQLPYILLAAQENAWGYQNRWQGIEPGPWGIEYNVASWR